MNAKDTNTSNVRSTLHGTRDLDVGELPPAVFARQVDDGRRRELARALHAPVSRAPAITERLDHMRALLAKYRAEAIALHARLVALELAGNDNVAPLRRALVESSVRIESIGKVLSDQPALPPWSSDRRLARGTVEVEPDDDWLDPPTLRRAR
jgi:hypothetical protein